jgi:hypothetical protein
MAKSKSRVLILVEGEKVETRLMNYLFKLYNIDMKYEIVSYNTNIYVLYDKMFSDGKPLDMDILQVLKEQDPTKKHIFEQNFTDILLIFDLDPHDSQFKECKISAMMRHFVESTDMGKLYLNYPMVEAFYHMKSIPDVDYNDRTATLSELNRGTYKQRVNRESYKHDYSKFAATRKECDIVIKQNIEKGHYMLTTTNIDNAPPNEIMVLNKQLDTMSSSKAVYVLCTCVFFISEYNPKFLSATF